MPSSFAPLVFGLRSAAMSMPSALAGARDDVVLLVDLQRVDEALREEELLVGHARRKRRAQICSLDCAFSISAAMAIAVRQSTGCAFDRSALAGGRSSLTYLKFSRCESGSQTPFTSLFSRGVMR